MKGVEDSDDWEEGMERTYGNEDDGDNTYKQFLN